MTGNVFESASYLGLALIALWIYVRFPNRRPETLTRAIARVVLAFSLFMVLPFVLFAFRAVFHGHTAGVAFVLVVAMPMLCGVMVSFIWLLARLLHDFGPDLPNGGHPATTGV